MSLAAYGQDGNGLQLEKSTLHVSSCFSVSSKKKKSIFNPIQTGGWGGGAGGWILPAATLNVNNFFLKGLFTDY